MAANQISLNAGEAKSAVSKIVSKAKEAQTTINSLEKDVRNTNSWWKGDSAVAFVDEFSKSKKEFDKMIECINKYSDLLNKAIQIQQDADAEIARQMRK